MAGVAARRDPDGALLAACRTGRAERWTPEAAEAELDRLLKQSVREHLVSDVPLGVWLSGGLDSSSLVHYAAEASSSRLKTFSITFRGRSFDEARYVRQVAEQYGTDHTELDLNPEQDLPARFSELAYYCDEPNADSGALPVWFLSRLTKAERHGGAQRRRRRRIVRRISDASRQLAGAHGASIACRRCCGRCWRRRERWPVSNDKIGFEYKLKRFLEGCLMPAARAHVYWSGTFDDAEKRALVQPRCRRRSIRCCKN